MRQQYLVTLGVLANSIYSVTTWPPESVESHKKWPVPEKPVGSWGAVKPIH